MSSADAFAAQRRVRDDALARELVELVVVRPQDRAGGDRVHADVGGELAGERAGEAGQARLRGAVDDVLLERAFRVDVGDVHDRALRLAQRRRGGLRQEQRGAQVGAHEVVPGGRGDLADRRGEERRGVVHQRVEPAEGGERLLDQRRQLGDVEQVGLDQRHGVRPHAVELGLQQPRLARGSAEMQHQARPRGVEAATDAGADALRAAGDEHDLALHAEGLRTLDFAAI